MDTVFSTELLDRDNQSTGKRVSFSMRMFENNRYGEEGYIRTTDIYNAHMEDSADSDYMIKYIESVLERVTGKKVTINIA